MSAPKPLGRLLLMPAPLDFGIQADPAPDIQDTLPLGVLKLAAACLHWVAENPKTTRQVLKRVHAVVPLAAPLQALDIRELPRPPKGGGKHPVAAPDRNVWPSLLAPALAGQDVALMSEAGLPAVADPGNHLVAAAHQLGVPVLALSGPSSLMLALAASGLQGQCFAFVGYLPQQADERAKRLKTLETLSRQAQQTQLVIETPYRNEALLQGMLQHLNGATRLSISSGLTVAGGWSHTDTVAGWRRARPAHAQPLAGNVPMVFSFLAN